MKLKDEYLKLSKEMLYETYLRIVYNAKNYNNITKNKMLEEIIKEYAQENYLYCICTKKELDFLKYIKNKKLSVDDIEKYEWEIKKLNEKCIFSRVTLEVFEEQEQNVQEALKTYEQNNKKGIEDVVIFIISKVKTNAIMLTKALTSMIESMFNFDEKEIGLALSDSEKLDKLIATKKIVETENVSAYKDLIEKFGELKNNIEK